MATISVLGAILALPTLFLIPGWLCLRRCGVEPLAAAYCGFGVTAAFAAAVVGLGVLLPWDVRATCIGALVVVIASSLWCALTAPRPLLPPRFELAGIGVFLAAFLAAAAFVAVPSRPPGIWHAFTVGPGRVDTPRWAGMPSDNTLPYRTGQVAFFKQGNDLRDRFSPGWWISDRTPLVGLEFAFSAGALDAHIRPDDPGLRSDTSTAMQVKDPYAYWLYNLVEALFAAAVVLGTFLLARTWKANPRVAVAAALVAGLSPGLFLNTIYTWPKPAIGYFVLVAAALALRRRAAGAGGFLALAYLCHPAGAFWAVSVAALLFSDRQVRSRWRGALGRFTGTAALVVMPWQLFTSLYMHAVSRWTFWWLGAVIDDRTHLGAAISSAWHQFVLRGIAGNLWVRVESTASSLIPVDLTSPGATNGMPRVADARINWANAHGVSIWGMAGLVLFPAVVVYLARRWPEHRLLVLGFATPYVCVAVLAAGFPDNWSSQSAYPLIGLIALFAGELLLTARTAVRRLLWCAIALELLSTAYLCEYDPYNAAVAAIALFAVLGIGAHVFLLGDLARTIGIWPPQPQCRTDPAPVDDKRSLRSRMAPDAAEVG